MNEGKAQGEAVKHQVERMTTVINEVIRAENKTRQFIQDNHAVILKLSHRLNRLLTELNASLETAHHLQLVEMIEGYIAEIESSHAAIHFTTEEFENQRMQLERGRLAEISCRLLICWILVNRPHNLVYKEHPWCGTMNSVWFNLCGRTTNT